MFLQVAPSLALSSVAISIYPFVHLRDYGSSAQNKCSLTKQNCIDAMLCLRDQADLSDYFWDLRMHGWILTIVALL